MTDEEYRQQVQQRWQETMALLGIEDAGPAPETELKKQSAPPPSQPAPKNRQVPTAPIPDPEAVEVSRPAPEPEAAEAPWTEAESAIPIEELPPRHVAREHHHYEPEPQEAGPEPMPMEQPAEVASADEAVEESAKAPEDDESEDRSRRRRGRRGRRGSKGETAGAETTADAAPGAEDESKEQETGNRRGRGRGRQRPAKAEVEKEEPASIAATDDADLPDEDAEDFSEWNVPSWQELIASLYRPER
jgi:hypothetical protein